MNKGAIAERPAWMIEVDAEYGESGRWRIRHLARDNGRSDDPRRNVGRGRGFKGPLF